MRAEPELKAAVSRSYEDPTRLQQAIAAAREHGVDASLIQTAEAALEAALAQARGTPHLI